MSDGLERERLVELVVELAEANSAAHVELSELAGESFEMPLPDRIVEALNEGAAARAVIAWILERKGTSPEMAAAVNRRLEQERGADRGVEDAGLRVPVDDETLRQLDAAHESLRRARLFDGGLDHGLRDAVLRADLAGC